MKKSIFSRFLIKAIALTCATVCLFGSLSACSCNGEKPDDGGIVTPIDGDYKQEVTVTDKFIVPENQSTCSYSILIPANRDENLSIAIDELQLGIKACTGYEMPITENYVEGNKYISVGNTKLYQDNKSAVDGKELGKTDTRILTVDDNVIIIGGDNEYTVYSVYAFMEKSFGFKWYTIADYAVNKANSIKLMNFDYRDKPDILIRCLYNWDCWAPAASTIPVTVRNRRMRCHGFDESFVCDGHTVINTIMKKERYMEDHPEWYTKSGYSTAYNEVGQLCLTNEELIVEFIERCKELIIAKPDCQFMQLGMEDDWNACVGEQYNEENKHKCTCVQQAKDIYGSTDKNRAGNFIIFANRVARELNAWMKDYFNDPSKEMYFPIYAYFHNLNAPVTQDEKGNYVPIMYDKDNDGVSDIIPDEHVMVMYAPLNNDFTYSIGDERNSAITTMVKQWQALTSNVIMYSYSIDYNAFEFPWNNLTTMQGSYTFAMETNFAGYIEEDATYYHYPSMQRLKNYVMSQMWWDGTQSVDELAFEFIDFYYKPVASEFKEYYKALKQFLIYQQEELKRPSPILNAAYAKAEYWPKDAVDVFDNMLNDMLNKLEPYKQISNDVYQAYFDRVNIEKIWTTTCYLENYGQYFNDSDYNGMVDFYKTYASEYKIRSDKIDEKVAKWRR